MLKNEQGFTLVEMMIVLLVIAVLLIITIPNVAKHNEKINTRGCDAYKKMVQAQIQSYRIDKPTEIPTIDILFNEKYITQKTCPDGSEVMIVNGDVVINDEGSADDGD